MKEKFYSFIKNLQDKITKEFELIDGNEFFAEDVWQRKEGGGGRTRILQNGGVFEKGGVNISKVYGKLPKSMQSYFKVGDVDFFACGLSLVMHPKNPMTPTVHANWRYFEMYDKSGEIIDQWFGGGLDLTPYYIFKEDIEHFHGIFRLLGLSGNLSGRNFPHVHSIPSCKLLCIRNFFVCGIRASARST